MGDIPDLNLPAGATSEFLLADYAGFQRLARFQPVYMPGGAQAMREPWLLWLAPNAAHVPIEPPPPELHTRPSLDTRAEIFQAMVDVFCALAPPTTVIFVWGVFWKRASAKAALITLIVGSVIGTNADLKRIFRATTLDIGIRV